MTGVDRLQRGTAWDNFIVKFPPKTLMGTDPAH